MPAFSISPAGPYVPPDGGDFPNYLQIQDEGTDLGTPTVDTLNFTGAGVTATRGTGENANRVTVDVPGGGSAGSPYAFFSLAPNDANPVMDGSEFSDWFNVGSNLGGDSADAVWDSDLSAVVVQRSGVYRVDVRVRLAATFEWPVANIRYGAQFGGLVQSSLIYRNGEVAGDSGQAAVAWSETAYLGLGESDIIPFSVAVFAQDSGSTEYSADVALTVTRVADYTPT